MWWFPVMGMYDASHFKSLFAVTWNLQNVIFSSKIFPPWESISGWKYFRQILWKKYVLVQNGIKENLCLANIFCGFVLLGVILSHVISGWCLHCSVSLQDTLGVIALLPDNLPSLSLCLWKEEVSGIRSLPQSPRNAPQTQSGRMIA